MGIRIMPLPLRLTSNARLLLSILTILIRCSSVVSQNVWSANATLKDQLAYLSPEAMDLLDRMFELDEAKRIDVKDIKTHPWFSLPMRPEYQDAIQKIESKQVCVCGGGGGGACLGMG